MITDNILELTDFAEKHSFKHDRMIETTNKDGSRIIGKNRYDALKKIHKLNLRPTHVQQLKDFEDYHGITDYLKKMAKTKEELSKRLIEESLKKANIVNSINKANTWNAFKKVWLKTQKKPFLETPESLKNIAPIVTYFSKDPEFLKFGVKDENGNFLSQPSLDKGLLIVGGYGNGKTSIMNTMQALFSGIDGYRFGKYSTKKIVLKYEEFSRVKNPEVLENFWNMLNKSDLYLDDVKTEEDASAYGKKNLINILIQERYFKGIKTHISCNYANGHNNDVKQALMEFKTRYSNQVYDRIFEMFNIIEFKGKSFRK